MTIETVTGTLAKTYSLLRPESILHVDELVKERRTNEELRGQWFYTPDGGIYFMDGKTPTLAITRGRSNPLFQDSTIDEYCRQLLKNKNYRPTPEETQRALQAPDTVLVDFTILRLQKYTEEFSSLVVNTQEYNTLNSEEQKLAERVYGKDDDFAQTMTMLAKADIRKTLVQVLNPDYVRAHAQENPFGRASWLSSFSNGSIFSASGRCVVNINSARGTREVRP